MQKRIYFAYGANTNREAMAIRCPKAKPIGAGHIVDYKLKFNNVADIASTKKTMTAHDVPCVIWEITEECEKALDRFEGFPSLYRKINVEGYIGCQYNTDYKGFAYKMNYSGFHVPSPYYVGTIRKGLKGFWDSFYHDDIDKHIDMAIVTSFRENEKPNVYEKVGGKQWS